ncbi:hypothetical protein L596_005122 [Steinernema carpocapsae]|uniref:Uncharacterized protein n=1 Tax=Steinernema carpocapsae TaxID=34508 RepID=A0A4V6I8K3_STECR|nr:hypothetical protein L596_005122 [Steinernema carpocapsae]
MPQYRAISIRLVWPIIARSEAGNRYMPVYLVEKRCKSFYTDSREPQSAIKSNMSEKLLRLLDLKVTLCCPLTFKLNQHKIYSARADEKCKTYFQTREMVCENPFESASVNITTFFPSFQTPNLATFFELDRANAWVSKTAQKNRSTQRLFCAYFT